MAYPVGLPVRGVSFGSAVVLESGTALDMSVTIKASRSLVHRPTGSPLVTAQTAFLSSGDGYGVLELPICNSPDMALGSTGAPITLTTGQVTHTYTATIRYLTPEGTTVGTVTKGPFTLLAASPSVSDLDTLLVGSTPAEGVPGGNGTFGGVTFHPSMSGVTFMAGTVLPEESTIPVNTYFFLIPEA